jgi:hypothetical protein
MTLKSKKSIRFAALKDMDGDDDVDVSRIWKIVGL